MLQNSSALFIASTQRIRPNKIPHVQPRLRPCPDIQQQLFYQRRPPRRGQQCKEQQRWLEVTYRVKMSVYSYVITACLDTDWCKLYSSLHWVEPFNRWSIEHIRTFETTPTPQENEESLKSYMTLQATVKDGKRKVSESHVQCMAQSDYPKLLVI